MAANLTDGLTPDLVKAWKTLLISAARDKDALTRIREKMPSALGNVLPGYGAKVSAAKGATDFLVGPDELLSKYEAYLKAQGECESIVRLYPRDFWE